MDVQLCSTIPHLNPDSRKLSSVRELAKASVASLDRKSKAKLDDIARKKKAIVKLRIDIASKADAVRDLSESVDVWRERLRGDPAQGTSKNLWPLKNRLAVFHAAADAVSAGREKLRVLKAAVHQHKRRLTRLQYDREKACQQAANPTLCLGSNRLFHAQFELAANGYTDHAGWRDDWRTKRSTSMIFEGNSATNCGNPFARLRKNDSGSSDLELRLPSALAGLESRSFKSGGSIIRCIDFKDLSSNHGNDIIENVLESGRPVTVRFLRDALSWKVMVSVDHVLERKAADFSDGALGVDLNAGHVSAALLDATGNPLEIFHIPCVTYGRSSAQAKDAIRKAAARVVELARRHGVPVIAERLDFSRKKETLKADGDVDTPACCRHLPTGDLARRSIRPVYEMVSRFSASIPPTPPSLAV